MKNLLTKAFKQLMDLDVHIKETKEENEKGRVTTEFHAFIVPRHFSNLKDGGTSRREWAKGIDSNDTQGDFIFTHEKNKDGGVKITVTYYISLTSIDYMTPPEDVEYQLGDNYNTIEEAMIALATENFKFNCEQFFMAEYEKEIDAVDEWVFEQKLMNK